MNNLIIKYGLYSFIILPVAMLISFGIFNHNNYFVQEVIGYSSMVVASLIAMVGVQNYKKEYLNNSISYWQAVKISLMILIIPSVLFGIFDVIYLIFIDPEFMNNYYNYYVEQMKLSMSAADFEKSLKDLESQKEMFANPFMSFLVMGFTMFLVGTIISLIFSFFIKTNK